MRDRLNNEQNAFESLEDAISYYLQSDDDDFNLIEEYIENMPNTRESVKEMLEAITSYDLLPIYSKLFTDCSALLSGDEMNKLKEDYKVKFSDPHRIKSKHNAFDSLEDAICNYMVSGEYDPFEEYIDNMPNTRETVNELLNACASYDLIEIYTKLLTECRNNLNAEERVKLEADYKKIFVFPLPSEIE